MYAIRSYYGNVEQAFEELSLILNNNNIQLISHRIITPSLENVFIHLVKKAS